MFQSNTSDRGDYRFAVFGFRFDIKGLLVNKMNLATWNNRWTRYVEKTIRRAQHQKQNIHTHYLEHGIKDDSIMMPSSSFVTCPPLQGERMRDDSVFLDQSYIMLKYIVYYIITVYILYFWCRILLNRNTVTSTCKPGVWQLQETCISFTKKYFLFVCMYAICLFYWIKN